MKPDDSERAHRREDEQRQETIDGLMRGDATADAADDPNALLHGTPEAASWARRNTRAERPCWSTLERLS